MRGITYKNVWKRLLDIMGSFSLLVILSPLLLAAMALVRLKLGSPIFFTQERLGLNGQSFRIWKFRSMTNCVDVWYVDHCSLMTDIRILLRTIPIVLGRAGVTAENHATMPKWVEHEAPLEDRPAE